MSRVAVLAGGRSLEHEVSVASAQLVLRHLRRERWSPWPVYLDREGLWWPAERPLGPSERFVPREGARRAMRPGAAVEWLIERARIDVVLPILHGAFGEDGTVQGMLELHDLPFAGSGCAASAVAMDKIRTRQALRAAGLPLPDAYVPAVGLSRADVRLEARRVLEEIGFPCFAKLDKSGSTLGVERVASEEELAAFLGRLRALERSREGGARWYAERALAGEEVTVGVLGNSGGELMPLPPVGIYPRRGDYFTRESKYEPGGADEVIPPRGLDERGCREVMDLGRRCHEALWCDGMSRTDMIVTADGPRILEVNTIPGMTETSLLPKAALAAGIPYADLLDRLLDLALARWGAKAEPGRQESFSAGEARGG